MRKIKILLSAIILFSFAACSTLSLAPAEFGWPIESVLKIDDKGFVKEDRYSFSFNTKPLFLEEMQDSLAYSGKSIRLIRNLEGFYFITAADFKNVYVFSTGNKELVLENKIQINELGLKNPAFNQRSPFIELIDEGNVYKLSSEGFSGGVK